jgi:hypothetical protein
VTTGITRKGRAAAMAIQAAGTRES